MLNLMAVQVVESTDDLDSSGVTFERLGSASHYRWVPCGQPVEGAEMAWDRVVNGQMDVQAEVVVENAPPDLNSDCVGGGTAFIEVVRENTQGAYLRLNTDREGWLVYSDTWYPGWIAHVDGERSDVFRANYLFRAVSVPEGEHEIVMTYRPPWFYLGALVSGIAWILLGWTHGHRRR
jgi:hypothetical protein